MKSSATGMTLVGLVLALVLCLSVNSLSHHFLGDARVDLTEQQLYTLSDGTKSVLSKIDEPISIKLYYSERLGETVPAYGVYAQRLRELLQEYALRAHGKIDLQVLDPTPFSEIEDAATAAGLQGVPLDQDGEQVYFGLVAHNSTDDEQVIPFFQSDREKFLEYDLTKLIQALAFPKKKVIGLVTGLTLDGDPMAQMRGQPSAPQAVMDQLRSGFDVRDISTSFDKVPDDVDVLMIVQPQELSDKTQYAIDQWVLAGGHALVFDDPNSEFQQGHPNPMAPPGAEGAPGLDRLLKAWGVELVKDKVVGDRLAARKVNVGGPGGRGQAADYLAWLSLKASAFNPNDPVTSELGQLNFATAGALQALPNAKTKLDPLVQTSPQSELIDAARVKGLPDVAGLLSEFKSANTRYTLAARITGPADTAFPDGPPKPADAKPDEAKPKAPDAPPLKTAKQPIDIIVVADSDLLDDRFWVRVQDFMGQRVPVPEANNADFVQNAVDSLAGSGELIGLRSRGTAARPFALVDEIQRNAEDRYRAEEKSLQDKLKATEAKLADIKKPDADGNEQLTPEQNQAIEQFRAEIIQTRQQLRQVQLALRQEIDRLKNRLVMLDVGLVPLGVAAAALILGIIRQQRRVRAA